MKKIIYSLLAISIIFVGCARFEDFKSEELSKGPTIQVDVPAVADSSFMLKLTPGDGTHTYSYVVVKANEPTTLNPYDVLKGKPAGVAKRVLEVAVNPTYTDNMEREVKKATYYTWEPILAPNTTYQIYAVAANSQGIPGDVVNVTVKTTDGLRPTLKSFKESGVNVDLTFSEAMAKGTLKVNATYYKEFDIANPITVAVPADSIKIAGSVVTVRPSNVNPGAFVTISFEEGAFKDIFGNLVAAYTSGLNMTTGKFTGVNYRAPFKDFVIKDKYFISPDSGSIFSDWAAFSGVVDFGFNVYKKSGANAPKSGDWKVIYKTKTKKAYYNLAPTDWSLAGTKLTFKLPVAPTLEDSVAVVSNAKVLFDVWGNPNTAYTKEVPKWTYNIIFTKAMFLGSFTLTGNSTYDGLDYSFGKGDIIEDTTVPNGLILTDFIDLGLIMSGEYDLDAGKMFLYSWDSLGVAQVNGTNYEFYNVNYVNDNAETIPFVRNLDGTLTSDEYGIIVYNPLTDKASYYDKLKPAIFTPATTPPVPAPRGQRIKSASKDYTIRPITDPARHNYILKKIKKR